MKRVVPYSVHETPKQLFASRGLNKPCGRAASCVLRDAAVMDCRMVHVHRMAREHHWNPTTPARTRVKQPSEGPQDCEDENDMFFVEPRGPRNLSTRGLVVLHVLAPSTTTRWTYPLVLGSVACSAGFLLLDVRLCTRK